MKLTKYEKETIICYNEEEATASVYTHNKKLIQKLKRLSEKYPDKVKPERPEHCGSVSYLVPKRCVSVREPYNDQRRADDSLRAKAATIRPPSRSIRSENK
ncbi:immunoglobulin [Ethanoligenens sp.]|jgi:hypothetical protein|uniref:immunoglobulin n=1 Tax=Ethanoligenens sp. TaxID=2099655 RepID=UPI0039EC7FD2